MRQPPDADLTAPERRYLERVEPEHWRSILLGLTTSLMLANTGLPLWACPAGILLFCLIAADEERSFREQEARMVDRARRRAIGMTVGPVPNAPESSWLVTACALLAGACFSWGWYTGGLATWLGAAAGVTLFVIAAMDPVARRRAAAAPDPSTRELDPRNADR